MHLLHVTAHLGGGVGKAHAALRSAMPAHMQQTYLLLEPPRDRRYADDIGAHGGEIIVARDLAHIAQCCATADIVQFEFWNHPKLFECLARTDFPPMRSVFWSHISGLFKPVVAPQFLTAANRFVWTTPASMALAEGLDKDQRRNLSTIGSGFGFPDLPTFLPVAPPSALPGRGGCDSTHPIAYLGTVDFIKMHPGLFDAIDALTGHAEVAIWGSYDPLGEVAAKANSMRHPQRIRFMGQTGDPQSALQKSSIFFYPLQPDHYGTAENALIEAMSLGLVPVVLANPAECAIVEHGVTGFVAGSIEECAIILDRLLAAPAEVANIGENAAGTAREKYTAAHSASAFSALWASLLQQPRYSHNFASITGKTPLDWYHATQGMPGEKIAAVDASGKQSKGTLAHFIAAFPDDACWRSL